ncbi:hypothetical protein Tco_1409740 [Tanacetum coccineum]
MVVVVVNVQMWALDAKNEVVVMDLKDPVANYPWLKHLGYEVVFVAVEVLEVQALLDPYEEAARQLLEQAPHPSEYVPDPIELEDHDAPLFPIPYLHHTTSAELNSEADTPLEIELVSRLLTVDVSPQECQSDSGSSAQLWCRLISEGCGACSNTVGQPPNQESSDGILQDVPQRDGC